MLDPYSYPTTTGIAEGVINVQTDGSGAAAVAVFCDPFFTFYTAQGATPSNSTVTYAYNTFAQGASSVGQLSNLFSTYRTVGGGVQVRNLMQPVSTQGRVFAAKIASNSCIVPAVILNNEAISGAQAFKYSANMDGIDSRILNLPESTENTMADLIQNVLPISFRSCSATNSFFRNSNTSAYLGGSGADALYFGSLLGKPNTGSQMQFCSTTDSSYGFDIILLRFTGCPANTLVAEVKYTLHYEGTPALATEQGVAVPDMTSVGPHMPQTARALETAASRRSERSSWVEDVTEIGKSFLKGVDYVGKIAGAVGEIAPTVMHTVDLIAAL